MRDSCYFSSSPGHKFNGKSNSFITSEITMSAKLIHFSKMNIKTNLLVFERKVQTAVLFFYITDSAKRDIVARCVDCIYTFPRKMSASSSHSHKGPQIWPYVCLQTNFWPTTEGQANRSVLINGRLVFCPYCVFDLNCMCYFFYLKKKSTESLWTFLLPQSRMGEPKIKIKTVVRNDIRTLPSTIVLAWFLSPHCYQ